MMNGRESEAIACACSRQSRWNSLLRKSHFLFAIAVLCGGLFATPAAAQWAAADIFPDTPVPAKAGPNGLDRFEGVLDTSPVERGLGRLRLKLPGGGTVEMTRDGFERRKDGDVTWRGNIVGEDGSRAILTVRNGFMAGRILRGLDEYEIRPGPGRSHVVEQVDGSVAPVEELVVPDVGYSFYDSGPDYSASFYTPPYSNSPDNIQLLAVYTPQARVAAGGTPQIEVRIQSMVDHVNTAFIDSGMVARIALIHTEEITYTDSGHVGIDLNSVSGWIPDATLGFSVPIKRSFFGADLVSLIVDNGGQCAGAAYVMHIPDNEFSSWAYNVSALSCGLGTLAHEIGHNMGFEHNPEDSARGPDVPLDPYFPKYPSYPWSFGHYVDGSFRTIMSYPTYCPAGCPTLMQFSNPDISFLGSPTGILDLRDNARTGDLTAPIVTNFLDAVMGAVVNRRVAASVEDVEEMADGSVVFDSTTLELGDGLGGVQAVGLRFQNINIPVGMRIDSAYLEFEAADIGSDATSVRISAEATDNAAPFSATPFDVTGRPATTASVQWDIPAWTTATEKHYSPDISSIIQEVVARPGWVENNSIAITVGGTGIRTALSHDGGAISAPLLHVEYTSPDRPETVEPPVAAYSYACAGLTCTFTDQSTDIDGTIVYWSWYFGEGTISYEQNPAFTFPFAGTYYVSLEVWDNQDWPAYIEKPVAVTVGNSSPVATNDAYTTLVDSPVSGNVLTDGTPDSDVNGDPLTVTANTNPSGGSVTVAANGAFTYTPNAGYTGTDSFTYTISDGNGGVATATVSVTVAGPAGAAPVATDNVYVTDEDVAVGGNALTDGTPDSDADGDPLTVTGNTSPLNGVVTVATNGTFTYTPNADFNGADSFTYTIGDGNGGTATATVTVIVNSVNDTPAASFTHSCAGLNCAFTDGSTDVEGAVAAWSWSFGDGAVSVVQSPAHSYAAGGTYTVSLTVTDGQGATDTATQALTVANTAPVATADAYTTDEDAAVSGNVLTGGTPDSDADGDALAVTANSSPLNGTVTIAVTGAFTYTPAVDFYGTDSFTYTVSDSNGGSATATVTITVNPVNDPPVAAFSYSCVDLTCTFTDLSTDIDDTIEFWLWGYGDGVNGAAATHTYADYGWYNVYLTVRDAAGATVQTMQKITLVDPANIAPVANNDAYTTGEDIAVSGNLLADGTPDSDANGDALTLTRYTSPSSGTLSIDSTGAFTYTPGANYFGTDSFTYTISDGRLAEDTATVTITVTSVNDAPVAAFAFSCDVLNCAFTDESSDPLDIGGSIAAWAWSFGDGATSTAWNPTHSYGGGGTYTVALTVTDLEGATSTVSETVTVANLANTAPVASANAYTTAEDTALNGNVLTDGTADSDADGDALTVTANTNPLNGTVTVAATGAFTYTPNVNFTGTDSFTYTISDGNGGSASATVTITVVAAAGTPAVNLTAASLVYGDVTVGTVQAASLAIQNAGTADLNVSGISVTGSADFALPGGAPTSYVIQPGRQVTVQVNYTPGEAGPDTGSLVITSDDAVNPSLSVSLDGNGVAASGTPVIGATPSIAFGDLTVGSWKREYLAIQNQGTADLQVNSLTLTGSADFTFFNAPATPFTIKPGRQASFRVQYTASAGPASGSVNIGSDDPVSPSVSVPLSGNGIGGTQGINLPITSVAYGDVLVGSSQRAFVSIQNLGTADLLVNSLTLTGSGDFTLVNAPAGAFTIKPGRQATIKVDYAPTVAGAAAGSIAINSDDPVTPDMSVSLSGNGVGGTPALNLTTASVVYGDVEVGKTQTASLAIQNQGTASLNVAGLAATGSSDFALPAGAPTSYLIEPGRQVTVQVNYTPGETGGDTGALVFTSDDAVNPNPSVSLNGNGSTSAVTPDINLPATSVAYGDVLVGKTQSAYLAIQNMGTANLTVSSLTLTGSADFALAVGTPTSFVVEPGRQATVKVNYSPSVTGAATGSLAIASDDPVTPNLSVSLSGNGLAGVADINLPVVSHDYGDVVVGTSRSAYIAIQNLGTGDLQVTGLALTGSGDFTLAAGTPTSFVVAAGRQVVVQLYYTPSAQGSVTGILTIDSSDTDEPSITVSLVGNGTPAI